MDRPARAWSDEFALPAIAAPQRSRSTDTRLNRRADTCFDRVEGRGLLTNLDTSAGRAAGPSGRLIACTESGQVVAVVLTGGPGHPGAGRRWGRGRCCRAWITAPECELTPVATAGGVARAGSSVWRARRAAAELEQLGCRRGLPCATASSGGAAPGATCTTRRWLDVRHAELGPLGTPEPVAIERGARTVRLRRLPRPPGTSPHGHRFSSSSNAATRTASTAGQRVIAFAVDGATRMSRLITDLLAFSRVGRSTAAVWPPVDLEPALCDKRWRT